MELGTYGLIPIAVAVFAVGAGLAGAIAIVRRGLLRSPQHRRRVPMSYGVVAMALAAIAFAAPFPVASRIALGIAGVCFALMAWAIARWSKRV